MHFYDIFNNWVPPSHITNHVYAHADQIHVAKHSPLSAEFSYVEATTRTVVYLTRAY